MKKIKSKVLLAIAFVVSLVGLSGCSGSEEIQGVWNAREANGTVVKIEITENTIKYGDNEPYEYKQIATGYTDGTTFYALKGNDVVYSIVIPDKDIDLALLLEPGKLDDYTDGKLVATMSKGDAPDYEQTVEKYLK